MFRPSNLRNVLLAILIVLIIMSLPFMIVNLIYAFNEHTCTNEHIQNYHISFTLDTWLAVQGFFDLGCIVVYIGFIFGLCMSRNIQRTLGWFLFLFIIATLFRLAWFIVGAIMYWGYLWPSSLCKPYFDTYMFIMLIVSMMIQFIIQAIFAILLTCYVGRDTVAVETVKGPPGTVGELDGGLRIQEPRPYEGEQIYQQTNYYETGTPMPVVPQAYGQGYYEQQAVTTVIQQPQDYTYIQPQQPQTVVYETTQNTIRVQNPQPYSPQYPPPQYPPPQYPPTPIPQQSVQQYLYGSQINRYQ